MEHWARGDNKPNTEKEQIHLSDTDVKYAIVKSETFLMEEDDWADTVQERKSTYDMFKVINIYIDYA